MRRAGGKGMNVCRALPVLLVSLLCFGSCDFYAARQDPQLALTPSNVRAERRLYDGAPPVIPHKPLNISCIECHTATGKAAPPVGFAPANPHTGTSGISSTRYCQQCHVFRRQDELFDENDFVGLAQSIGDANRLYPGAPPVIPHRIFMRENCAACHGGPVARPEILCRHTERTNCRQCHVPIQSREEATVASF